MTPPASRIRRNATHLLGGTAVGQVATAATLVVAARELSVRSFGLSAAVLGVAALLVDALDFGSNSAYVHETSKGGERPELGELVGAKCVFSGLALIVLIVIGSAVKQIELVPYMGWVVMIWARSVQLTLNCEHVMRQDFAPLGRTVLVDRLAAFGGVTALAFSHVGTQLDVLPWGFAFGACAGLAYQRMVRREPLKFRVSRPWLTFSTGRHFGLTAVVSDLVGLDVLFVGAILGAASAAIFALPSRLVGPANSLVGALASASFPAACAAPDDVSAFRLLKAACAKPTAVVIGLFLVGAVACEPVVLFLFGHRYADAVVPVRLYLLGCAFTTFGQLLQSFLLARGHSRYVSICVAVTSIAALPLIWLGAALGGVDGATVGFLTSSLALALLLALKSRLLLAPQGPSRLELAT